MTTNAPEQLDVGDPVPEISLKTASGETIQLRRYPEPRWTVIFFYPRDGTPICTQQVCAFRDSYEQFCDLGAIVIGVSESSDQSHQHFSQKHDLPFHLVSDREGQVRKAFGIRKSFGLIPQRITFVIDPAGLVKMVFSAQWVADEHVKRALHIIRSHAESLD